MNTRFFQVLLLTFLFVKIIIDLFGIDHYPVKTHRISHFSFNKDYKPCMNIDEYELSRSAKFLLLGYGFVTDVNFDKPDYRQGKITRSALRPKYQILVHVAGIKIYQWLRPEYMLKEEGNMPKNYYQAFSFIILILKNIFLLISIPFFLKLSRYYLNGFYSKLATLFYIGYPSIFFFIGYYNLYDCILMPVFVMVISMIITGWKKDNMFSWKEIIVISILLSLTLIKSQSFLLIPAIYFSLLIISLKQINRHLIRFIFASASIVILFSIPMFYLNYKDYNAIFITTQRGSVLLHSHSDHSRGSWDPRFWDKHKAEHDSILQPYRHLLSDELSESKVYSMLAWKWIKENPLKELKLILRKSAIFFFPHNYLNWKINIVTLFFHLCFFCSVFYFLFHWKNFDLSLLMIYFFIVSVWLINVIFLVEYRWRLFIDPFLVLTSFIFIEKADAYFRKKILAPQKT